MRDWKKSSLFLSLTALLLLVSGIAMLTIGKGELHLLLCSPHTPAGDIFMRCYTQVGEWVPYVVVLALLLYKTGWSLWILTDIVVSGLIARLVKLINTPRPLTWFGEQMPDVHLPLVQGVHMSYHYSFPSGHTTSFFALFLALTILVENTQLPTWAKKSLQVAFFALAALGGYSRIYLSQHFLIDVFGGCIIGIATTLLLTIRLDRLKAMIWWNTPIKSIKNALF